MESLKASDLDSVQFESITITRAGFLNNKSWLRHFDS